MSHMVTPDEDKVWRFICQVHVRGASAHLDVRLQIDENTLVGWTLDLVKSILAELILKFSNEEEFMNALENKKILKNKNWRDYLKEVIEDASFKKKEELSNSLDDKYKDMISSKTESMKYKEIEEIILPYKERIKVFFANPNNKALTQKKQDEPCISQETLVVTESGLKKAKDVTENDKVINTNGEFQKIRKVETVSPKDLYEVKARHSLPVKVDGDHPFLVNDVIDETFDRLSKKRRQEVKLQYKPKWVKARDLHKNMILLFPKLKGSEEGSYEEGLLHGFFLGDGSRGMAGNPRSRVWMLFFNSRETEKIEEYYRLIKTLFGVNPWITNCKNNCSIISFRLNRKGKNHFFEQFYKNGEKHFPPVLFRKNRNYARGFIQGLIDSDGYERGNKKYIINTNLSIINAAVLMLTKLNILPSIRYRRNRGFSKNMIVELSWSNNREVFDYGEYLGTRVRSICKVKPEPLINIVTEDHTIPLPYMLTHNTEWMYVKGRVEKGEVGGTAELPGFFVPIDFGRVEFLSQKPYLHEYQFHGEVFNGKFVVRQIAGKPEWKKAGKERIVWMTWRTKDDDLPYVLKQRAVEQEWMPPEGKSALPEHLRKQVPEGFQYWKSKGEKAKEIRDELVKAIKKGEVSLKTVKEILETVKHFAVKRLFWKGPLVIRGMPQIFYMLIFYNDKIESGWYFTLNPLEIVELSKEETENMIVEEFMEKHCFKVVEKLTEQAVTLKVSTEELTDELLKDSGKLLPKHPLNPNKELPLFFDTIEKGTAIKIGEEKDQFIRYRLNGKKWKGIYILKRESPSSKMWKFNRAELPKAREMWLESEISSKEQCELLNGKWISNRCRLLEEETFFTGKTKFVLHRHYDTEITPHWDIRILTDEGLLEFNVYKNPAELKVNEEALANKKTCPDYSWFIMKGKELEKNVNNASTKIDVLDKGEVEVISHNSEQCTLTLKGEHFEGHYQYVKSNGKIRRISSIVEKYAPVSSSGKILGDKIKPENYMDAYDKPIMLQDSFVYLANPDRITTGDIDLIIRGPIAVLKDENYPEMTREQLVERIQYYKGQLHIFDDWYNRALHFRLYRAMQAKHPEMLNRLHLTNDFRGGFTDYTPIYDLVLVPSNRKSPIRMSRQDIENEIRESFMWARNYEIDSLKSTDEELWIRGIALLPTCSQNIRCYSQDEIKKMARTAINKPITVNHGEHPYENLKIGIVEDAEEEEGKLEFIAKITDKEWIRKIRNMKEEERKLSIGANPREIKKEGTIEYPEGLVIDEISIIVPPAKPGVPETKFEVKMNGWR